MRGAGQQAWALGMPDSRVPPWPSFCGGPRGDRALTVTVIGAVARGWKLLQLLGSCLYLKVVVIGTGAVIEAVTVLVAAIWAVTVGGELS